ncbi:MAG: hypothetical protein NTZ90_04315 [Proteobacteria bacterium]|nr:hypothetical protein [Pseudomonadota bacterium]
MAAFAAAPQASGAKDKTYEFEYPELSVTPSASERLQLEAKSESAQPWTAHIPTQASALMTLFASTQAMHDPGRSKSQSGTPLVQSVGLAGVLISLGWIGATAGLSASYRPYGAGVQDIKHLPAGSKREQLSRQRLAEESLEAPATLSRRLKWLSVVSNVTIAGLIAATAGNDMTKVVGGLAAGAAFAPLIFPEHWEDVGNAHQDYKKRIYGPVTSATIYYDQVTRRAGPAFQLVMDF